MAFVVADSDILIDALCGREPAMAAISTGLRSGNLATTVITQFELESGVRTPDEHEQVGRLMRPLKVLPLDADAALRAAEVRRKLEQAGTGIGMADYLIAGICLSNDSTLFTRNLRHFERVDGLRLYSWA